MKFLKYSLFLIIIGTVKLTDPSKNDYLSRFTNYLQKESKLYQVMFVVGDHMMNYSSSRVNPLVREVGKHFPTLCISLSSFRYQFIETNYSSALQNPRRTTLFILFLSGKLNENRIQVTTVGNQLHHLSRGRPHPKCLINLFPQSNSSSIKKLLQSFWSNEFLDIAVMTQLNDNQEFLSGDKLNQSILHQTNRFAGTYTAQRITNATEWFPNKLRNLHGYALKFLHLRPKNDKLTQLEIAISKRFCKLFSKVMNCNYKMHFVEISRKFNIQKYFKHYRLEMTVTPVQYFLKDDNYAIFMKDRVTRIGNKKAVIPKNSKISKITVMSEELITMMCVTIGTIALLRMTAIVLKLSRRTWETFNISQIVMGLSSVNEPEVLSERIILGVLLVSCIAYSSYFYSVILDISWRPESEITTLKELASSDLTPMTDAVTKKHLLISPILEIQRLGTKSIVYPDQWTDFDCLDFLSKHENVTCLIPEAEKLLKIFQQKTQKMNMKVLPEVLSSYFQIWTSRFSSPYIDSFNEIILKASESGLTSKLFDYDALNQYNVPPALEELSKEKLLPLVWRILAFGYTLASVVFIAEILSIISWSKIRQFCVSRFNRIFW